jgi:peptidyl-prolyl cis-trans isomerase C
MRTLAVASGRIRRYGYDSVPGASDIGPSQATVEACAATGSSRLAPKLLARTMRRLLREPLIHFLLIGTVLFGLYSFIPSAYPVSAPSKEIRVSLEEIAQLTLLYQSQWRRLPTPQDLERMVENKVEQEILYREALAKGLDKDDEIVKRRMAQKMQFLAEDVAAAREPTTAELRSWFEKNSGKFAQPPRLGFRHLYFSPDRRGARARDDAEQALAKLAGQPVDATIASSLADPFMFQDYYRDRAPDYLGKEFGPPFALAVAKLVPGSWQGPIESGFGWHLVFVDTSIPGRVPAFEEIEGDVKTVWLSEQKATAWDKAYKDMRAQYTVLIPAPPDAQTAARVAATPRPKAIPTSSGEGRQ